GDTVRYHDGIKVTVTSIDRFTKVSEYDSKPSAGETAFRININVDNGSEQPIDLDDFSVLAEGATKGGEAAVTTWENGSAEITGR
ncbi:hypothetical protein KBZ21_36115, partial [Streptomyces sp. A73]|nr:hypothetical protein [Streptomyces sp. A73]